MGVKTLKEIYSDYQTPDGTGDKGTLHSYIEPYDDLFSSIRFNKSNLLEIGVAGGYSMKMWKEYFENSIIYGIDVDDTCCRHEEERIIIAIGDATNKDDIKKHFNNIKFNIIIDDGSHRLEDQLTSYQLLNPYLTNDGIYIIEDVVNISRDMKHFLNLNQNVSIIDRIRVKGRYDDVLVVIKN